MPNIPFYKAGSLGIIKDLPPEELPPAAWSDGNNVRFEDGKIVRGYGVQNTFGTPLGAPRWLMPVYTSAAVFWVYADSTKLYATDGSAHADVSRTVGGAYAMTTTDLWTGGILSGIPVITDGVDVPQMWASPALSNDFANLTAWPSTDRCKTIKPFKNFLVAMNITISGTQYGQLVRWSAPAVPGAVPPSWDVADPATLAGEVELGEDTPGAIQDGLVLRDTFIIYKDNSVWGMQHIGGQSVMRFFPIFVSSGVLSNHCVKQIKKGMMHFVATGDDILVHDGQNAQSILDRRWKRYLRNNLAESRADLSFVATRESHEEAWFCFSRASDVPDTALIWNWHDDTITMRDLLPGTTFLDSGPVLAGGEAWDSGTGTWDSDTSVWDTLNFRIHFFNLLGANVTKSKLQIHDDESIGNYGDDPYTAFVERTAIVLSGQDRATGELKEDYAGRKICRRIWIKASGAPFYVQIGAQEDNVDDPVVYEAAQLFTPGTDRYLDWTANGRYIAVKFYSTAAANWVIEGFNLEVEFLGEL